MIRPFVLAVFLLLAGHSARTSAIELQCQDNDVVVQGARLDDLKDGCHAARSAALFFESVGLSMPRNVSITIADVKSTAFLEQRATGIYDGG